VFDVLINGSPVIEGLDLAASVRRDRAFTKQTNVLAKGGLIDNLHTQNRRAGSKRRKDQSEKTRRKSAALTDNDKLESLRRNLENC
jgi:hypothetical protein